MRDEKKTEFLQADANIILQHQNKKPTLLPGVKRSFVCMFMGELVSVSECGSVKPGPASRRCSQQPRMYLYTLVAGLVCVEQLFMLSGLSGCEEKKHTFVCVCIILCVSLCSCVS